MCDTTKTLIQKIYPDAVLPQYATPHAVGADVCAYLKGAPSKVMVFAKYNTDKDAIIISPGGRVLIPTGLRIKPADKYEIQVRSRSGLPLKTGLIVGNSPGTVDSDYTGELGVILINTNTDTDVIVTHGERIAQIVLAPVARLAKWNTLYVPSTTPLSELVETHRGTGGFGSTGGISEENTASHRSH